MKKKKILYFMDGIGNAGGIQEMAINWVQNFDSNKIQVDILSYDTGKKDNYTERFEKYGGKVYLIPTFTRKGSFFKSLSETKKFFDEHRDYDIIHAHASSKAYFVLREAKKHDIKIRILHSHCTQFINNKLKSLIIGNLLKPLAVHVATNYFACSHEAGYFLFGKKRMLKEGMIVPNGIALEKFTYDEHIEKKIRNELGLEDKIIIGNIGRFKQQKNHDLLIDIFYEISKKNNDAVLVLVGTGELFENIKAKVTSLNLSDKVKFLGYRSDVNDVVQSFDVLVMTSLFEGLPVTAVEAQAVGVPCVLSNNITKDAKLIPNVSYVKLNADLDVWASSIVDLAKKGKCKDPKKYLIENNYDMALSAKLLENFYLQTKNEKKG